MSQRPPFLHRIDTRVQWGRPGHQPAEADDGPPWSITTLLISIGFVTFVLLVLFAPEWLPGGAP